MRNRKVARESRTAVAPVAPHPGCTERSVGDHEIQVINAKIGHLEAVGDRLHGKSFGEALEMALDQEAFGVLDPAESLLFYRYDNLPVTDDRRRSVMT